MAQIVTITNPLTGQPAQVDQLDHTAQQIDDAIARALPGGAIDITLQNKAPAGFGLGTTPKNITDWNDANVCGWYTCDSGAANSPDSNFGWFGLTYTTGNPEIFVQDVFTVANVDKYYHCRRMYYPGTGNGTPWEWVDPLLHEGVEYRTTERYLGKPVYVMAVGFGNLPSAGTKTVDIFPDFAAEYILDVKGVTDNCVFPFSSTDGDYGSISLFLGKYGGCRVTTTTTFWENTTATIVAKYTKPT